MTTTYNVEGCTCGQDHDSLEYITLTVLYGAALAFDEGASVEPRQIGETVEAAARQVGWYRNVDLATRSFAAADCICGLDHDDLTHIVGQTVNFAIDADLPPAEAVQFIARAATEAGWVKL